MSYDFKVLLIIIAIPFIIKVLAYIAKDTAFSKNEKMLHDSLEEDNKKHK